MTYGHVPLPGTEVARSMHAELARWSVGPQMQYADLAGRYVAALEGVVNTVTSEAQLVVPTRMGAPGDAEVVAWRIDGNLLDDGEFTFATRISLLASRADTHASQDMLTDARLTPRLAVPAVLEVLGAKGLGVNRLAYEDVPLEEVTGPYPIVKATHTKIRHILQDGDTERVRLYGADRTRAGERVEFPALPRFEAVASLGYAAFCLSKVDKVPVATEMTNELSRAAQEDAAAPYKPDNLTKYAQLESGAPQDIRERVQRLADALYGFRPNGPMPSELIAAVLDPYAAEVATLAGLNKSKYVRRIENSREFTRPLTRQLGVVAAYADRFQMEFFPAMLADKEGYDLAMGAALKNVAIAADQAEAFGAHISSPYTLSLDSEFWDVRAK